MALGEKQLREVGALGVIAQVDGEVGVTTQHSTLAERALQGADIELREVLAQGTLRGLYRSLHQRGRPGQRLGLPVSLPHVEAHEGRGVPGDVLASLVGLALDDRGDPAAREEGEPGHHHQGDDRPREDVGLPELRSTAGHVEGRERRYAGLPDRASLFIFTDL